MRYFGLFNLKLKKNISGTKYTKLQNNPDRYYDFRLKYNLICIK